MFASPIQILLVIVLVILLFGAGRVPSIMENLGKGINSFKKGLNEEDSAQKKITHKKDEDPKKDSEDA